MVIDCNNFFVSCERLFRPDLEGKPVLVLSSNDGCVVARSQEVKDIGVPMGAPHFQIKDIIKDSGITVFSGNHTSYRNISRRVMQVIMAEEYRSEQYSIDEAFIIYKADTIDDALLFAQRLRMKIRRWVGIPVSVGIGFSKTQAKLASEYAKKTEDGVFFVDKKWSVTAGANVSIGTVWGIGRRSAVRYREYGISTLLQLIEAPAASLQKFGGVVALRQQAELCDRPVFAVGELAGPQKSLMSSQTFGIPTANKAIIYSAVAHHVEAVAEDLQRKNLVTDTIQVYIRPKDRMALHSHWWPVHLPAFTNGNAAILKAVISTLEAESLLPYWCNKVGVLALRTRSVKAVKQAQLFTVQTNQTTDCLDDILAGVIQKHGKHSLQIGTFSKAASWQARHVARSPQYVTCWSDVPTVKAKVVLNRQESAFDNV